jgi:hypothetical protein
MKFGFLGTSRVLNLQSTALSKLGVPETIPGIFIASNIMKCGLLGKSNMLIMNLKSEFGSRPPFLS